MNFSQRTEVSNCSADRSSLTNASPMWAAHLEGFCSQQVSPNSKLYTQLHIHHALTAPLQFSWVQTVLPHGTFYCSLLERRAPLCSIWRHFNKMVCPRDTKALDQTAALIWLGIGNVFELCLCQDKPGNGKRVKSVHLRETLGLLHTRHAGEDTMPLHKGLLGLSVSRKGFKEPLTEAWRGSCIQDKKQTK